MQLAHIKLLLQLYGVEPPESDEILRLAREANQRGWWTASSYGDTLPKWFRDYVGLEDDAEEIWAYDPELVHGLLQVPGYVRAVVLAARPSCSSADLERSVDLRQARQDKLYGDMPPKLNVDFSATAADSPSPPAATTTYGLESANTFPGSQPNKSAPTGFATPP